MINLSSALALLACVSLVTAQSSLSSTSQTTCLTKLGTSSVAPIPTTTNLRSLTIDTIQKSTYTPTATSTPPDTTTTFSFTEFPTTTTTVFNPEIDTFSTTTTIIDQVPSTVTVVVSSTTTNTQYTTVYGTTTVPTPPSFTPAQVYQAQQQYTKPKGKRSPAAVGIPLRLAARQAAASAPASNPAASYIYTEAVSCTGVVEFFSVKTSLVATASAVTSILPVITDSTSVTETTTITSSVLQTPASTTETISSTITTTSIAGTTTSTNVVSTSTTVTVQGAQTTVYAACQANNFISTDKKGNPIIAIAGPGQFGQPLQGPEAVLSNSNSYACCVACITTYGNNCGGAAFNSNNNQCLIYDGTQPSSGNPIGGCNGFGFEDPILGYYGGIVAATGRYTLSDGPCGAADDLDPKGTV